MLRLQTQKMLLYHTIGFCRNKVLNYSVYPALHFGKFEKLAKFHLELSLSCQYANFQLYANGSVAQIYIFTKQFGQNLR